MSEAVSFNDLRLAGSWDEFLEKLGNAGVRFTPTQAMRLSELLRDSKFEDDQRVFLNALSDQEFLDGRSNIDPAKAADASAIANLLSIVESRMAAKTAARKVAAEAKAKAEKPKPPPKMNMKRKPPETSESEPKVESAEESADEAEGGAEGEARSEPKGKKKDAPKGKAEGEESKTSSSVLSEEVIQDLIKRLRDSGLTPGSQHRGFDRWMHRVLGGGIITEILVEIVSGGLGKLSNPFGRNNPARKVILREGEAVAEEVVTPGRVRVRSWPKLIGVGIAVSFLLFLLGGVVLVYGWPLLVLLVFAGWYGYKWLDEKGDRNVMKWVGDDLPTVLKLSETSWEEFCTDAEAWLHVYETALEHLDSKLPWFNAREDRIDNELIELTRRINLYYGGYEAAAAHMDTAEAQVPPAVYKMKRLK